VRGLSQELVLQETVLVDPDATNRDALEVFAGAFFCSNEKCVLHLQRGDARVFGYGEWAVRPDGVVTSRRLVNGQMLCDVCGRMGGWFSTGGRT
jgi:hypothetical protein